MSRQDFDGIVCAAIVAYGNRAAECVQAAESALASGVDHILVVDNGMTSASYEQVIGWVSAQGARASVTQRQEEVRGSAYGFGKALAAASAIGDWVWLLDDDNIPEAGSLAHLRAAARRLPNTVLFARRTSNGAHSEAAAGQNPYPPAGAFLSFDVLSRVFRRGRIGWLAPGVARVPFGPYGGMFLSSEIIRQAPPPPLSYELYVDDHRYSAGLTEVGVDLGLVLEAKVHESGSKWFEELPSGPQGTLARSGVDRGRFVLRNEVAFSLFRARGRTLRWSVNRSVYLAALGLYSLISRRSAEWLAVCRLVGAGENLWAAERHADVKR